MLRIKKLDIFILTSFSRLFTGTFFICLFIFMMQFLWKYVDEMVGKGLEVGVLAQFFFYSALTLVPVSLPLAVLLAALITFGNFGERFELLAMKAAGVSLFQIMRPLVVFITLVAGLSFYFQNVISPMAQTKLYTLLISMKQKSPEVDIPEGVFYDEIDGYNLYVRHKNRDTGMLYDVLIYNLDKGFENAQIIKADSGRMEMTADKQHLYLHLYSGEQFENLKQQSMSRENVPYRRETFGEKHALIEFDSDFNMVDEGIMSGQSNSKNMATLQADIDSMAVRNDSLGRAYFREAMAGVYKVASNLTHKDTARIEEARLTPIEYDADSLFRAATLAQKQKVMNTAVNRATSAAADWNFKGVSLARSDKDMRRHWMAWHEKLTLSLACIIFLFIGVPLGGIIRKGGLGMPVVVSVLIFIVYYIIDTSGKKLARDGHWVVWTGMWLSTAVLAPLGAFLTCKANNDSTVLDTDAYLMWIKTLLGIRSERHLFRKEVIIDDPRYEQLPPQLEALTADCRSYAEKKQLKRAPNYFRLWMNTHIDEEVEGINERMEALIEEMSNTRSSRLVAMLNNYPIVNPHAHVRPFKNYRLNIVCGAVLPVGLFFYFRIWMFRIRLDKDMERIKKTNNDVMRMMKDDKFIVER